MQSIDSTISTSRETYPSRWLTLASAFMFLMMSGMAYAFALISEVLKDRLNLKQSEIDTIAILGTVGAYTGIIPGLFSNRYGPSVSIWLGIAITCTGCALLTGITTQYISTQSVALTCFANFLFNHGTSWFSTVSMPLCAQNFPEKDHGKLIGLGKGYMGIGSAFFAAFKSGVADGDADIFMISTNILIFVASLVFGRFIVLLPPQLSGNYQGDEINKYSITRWYIIAFMFAVYLVVLVMIQSEYSLNALIRYPLFGLAAVLWLSPWGLALFGHGDRTININDIGGSVYLSSGHSHTVNTVNTQSTITSASSRSKCKSKSNLSDIELLNDYDEDPDLGQTQTQTVTHDDSFSESTFSNINTSDVGMPAIFRYWQLYALYMITVIVYGSGIAFMDNTPQIVESASSDALNDIENTDVATSIVAIISFGSFCGRLCGGFLVDYFAEKWHCSFWLIVPPFIMTLTQISLFFGGSGIFALRIGACFIGMAFGWLASLLVVCVSNLWGTTYLSGNYALFDSPAAVGSAIYSRWIFATLYSYYAEEEREQIHYYEGKKCYGSDCYKWTFLLCGASSAVALILAIVYWMCTPKKKRSV